MSYGVYKILHILGITMVVMGLAAAASATQGGGSKEDIPARKVVGLFHGVGMLIVITGGMGLMARIGAAHDGLPPWIWAKLGLWTVVGALYMIPLRAPRFSKLLWFALPLVVATGAWIALTKPGM